MASTFKYVKILWNLYIDNSDRDKKLVMSMRVNEIVIPENIFLILKHEPYFQTYTMQNDIPHHREVLNLLNQLLTLRVNYCMLDSDQVFIGFLLKQLELIEQHEIP